jgi:hypothetical protein
MKLGCPGQQDNQENRKLSEPIMPYLVFSGLYNFRTSDVFLALQTCGRRGTQVVLLPGFQKGRDIKASQGKGREQSWPKKGNLRRTRKNLKNRHYFTPFTSFRVNKMFSLKF